MDAVVAEVVRRRRLAIALFSLIDGLRRKKRREKLKPRLWSRSRLLQRENKQNAITILFEGFAPEDPSTFTNYIRMQEDAWSELLTLVTPHIQKQNTVMREAIPPRDRLSVTLRFLATGSTFQDLSYATRISANTISKIVNTTLEAIIKVLEAKVMTFPSTVEEWILVANKFETLWNFPHCIGSLDGKRIKFRPHRKDGSKFHKYNGVESIVFLALVDAEYKFLFIDIGKNGRIHDSVVFRESPLGTRMNNGNLNLPPPCEITGFDYKLPYVFVGDDAFALKQNLLKPYPDRGLTLERRVFNYRLSRARRSVENAFGILANRWRILLTTLPLSVEKVERITYACALLHNYIIMKKSSYHWYVSHNYRISIDPTDNSQEAQLFDNPHPLQQRAGNRSSNDSLEARDKFSEYFNTAGTVPFQYTAIETGNR